MQIKEAAFISSITDLRKSPQEALPEFAFIGRSNVGKSSLINMLTGRRSLAKTSGKPGKTQTINHFKINNRWYIVDLPGYGYAKVSKSMRHGFGKIIEKYVLKSEHLNCLFILIDARLDPQAIDLDFIQWVGKKGVPISLIFTKTDKVSRNKLHTNVKRFEKKLLESWSELPSIFISSATEKTGKSDILDFIDNVLNSKDE